MHGVIQVRFDQTSKGFPFFLMGAEYGQHSTLAAFSQGTEYFIIPHVRMAWDHNVEIELHKCEYTLKSCEPYKPYMCFFEKEKNEADRLLKEATEELEKAKSQDKEAKEGDTSKEVKEALKEEIEYLRVEIDKQNFRREQSKLLLVSLTGRNNMAIDRDQSILTKSPNDVVCLLGDGLQYQKVQLEDFVIGSVRWYRMKFQEGSYEQHLEQYNVCPYLSAYVLGYSKMLMQADFQFLDSIGAELLYTDTDSIVFIATDHQWEQYRRKFVPEVKTFGGMVLEEEGVRAFNIGAKKYVVEHDGGSYSWHANGIRARQNVHLDIRAMFEAVLRGQIEKCVTSQFIPV